MFNPKPKNDPHFHGFPLQCIWLKINGAWPLIADKNTENKSLFDLFYPLWSYCVILTIGITLYFHGIFLINIFGDIKMMSETCCTFFLGVLNMLRLIHMRLNHSQFKDIIAEFVNDIWISKYSHPQIGNECMRNMRIFLVETFLLSCLITIYDFLPLVVLFFSNEIDPDDKPFAYKMMFPFDAQRGWYPLTYFFTASAGIYVCTTAFAEDSIFGFLVTHTCGQFRLLHEAIDTLVPDTYETVFKTIGEANALPWHFQQEYLHRLSQIAHRHNKIIEFAKSLENFFNPIILVNFVISSLLICVVGFQLFTGKDTFIGDYVKFIFYILSSLSQLYVLCWSGDTLIQISLETAKHLFNCNWEGGNILPQDNATQNNSNHLRQNLLIEKEYSDLLYIPANKEFRQDLTFMILCSQHPVRITAAKFYTLSLESFTTILGSSMSYFTLLLTLYNKDQEI